MININKRGLIWIFCLALMGYYMIRDMALFAQSRPYQPDLGQSVVRLEERIDNHIASADYAVQELLKYRMESDRRITALEGIADSSTFLLRAIAVGIFGIIAEKVATWAKAMRRRNNSHSPNYNDNDYEE